MLIVTVGDSGAEYWDTLQGAADIHHDRLRRGAISTCFQMGNGDTGWKSTCCKLCSFGYRDQNVLGPRQTGFLHCPLKDLVTPFL